MSLTKAYLIHKQLGGKFINYAEYLLPMSYQNTRFSNLSLNKNQNKSRICEPNNIKGGVITETLNTRDKNKCSLFDVSHMGQYRIYGKDKKHFLDNLVASDILNLAENKSLLSVFTNNNGGIMDDVIITNQGDYINLVCNASNKTKIQSYLENCKEGDVDIRYNNERQLYALQGPQSLKVLNTILKDYHTNDTILNNINNAKFMTHIPITINNKQCDIYFQGYTGEKGVEISVPDNMAEPFFSNLLEKDNVHLAGLGSRDILRLEAGYCLYGSDIDENINILEARMAWILGKNVNNRNIQCKRQRHNFPGSNIILNKDGTIKYCNFEKIRTGLISETKGIIPKKNNSIYSGIDLPGENDKEVGYITSGGFSPHLNKNIAMGYINLTKKYDNLQKQDICYNKIDTPVKVKGKKKLYHYNISKLPILS